jgi:aryl-alcohol dehydrogenase-like predicted oxidoreductase
LIDGVRAKRARVLPDERGRLGEIIRADDPWFEKFGQVYFTTTYPGVVKAWHFHRLQTDHVDLYQIHWPDGSTPVEESWEEMVRLQKEGKTRFIGVCNFGVDLLARCEAIAHVQSLQPIYNLLERGIERAILPWCRDHGTGIVAYSPMQSGLLTEGFGAKRIAALAPDDWRRRSPDFRTPALERNLALRDALRPIALRHETTVAAVAVAWTLAWPGVSGAIVGARAPEQIDGWLRAASLELTVGDLDEIAAAISSSGAGSGPVRP